MRLPIKILTILLCISIIFVLYWLIFFKGSEVISEDQNDLIRMVRRVNYLSEWDNTEEYRITRFVGNSLRLGVKRGDAVTLVTQSSTNNLHYLVQLAEFWQGPISIAVFCVFNDVTRTLQSIARLRFCHYDVNKFVTFHLVTYGGNGNVPDSILPSVQCTEFEEDSRHSNYALAAKYPVNLLRNTALHDVSTPFFFVVDVDMLPNPGLLKDFSTLARSVSLDNNTAYIVPAFEIEARKTVPLNKDELLGWKEVNLVRPFYDQLCPHCQYCVQYKKWLEAPKRPGLQAAYNISWMDPCEPFYIGSRGAPLYDETFQQYGFNRISQLCELQMAGYIFTVLDNAFLLHIGLKTEDKFHATKDKEQEINRKRYREFKVKMRYKYPLSPRTC